MQSARLVEMSIILAMQPLDILQKEVIRASEPLLDNIGIMKDAGNGLDWSRAAVQLSHIFVVSKTFKFCTTCWAVQAPVKFKVFVRAEILSKATESALFAVTASWLQIGKASTLSLASV